MRSNEKFTRRSEDAIEKARRAAGSLGHSFVGTEHLLLGILREEDGIGSRVLQRRGLREEALSTEILWKARRARRRRWDSASSAPSICCSVSFGSQNAGPAAPCARSGRSRTR